MKQLFVNNYASALVGGIAAGDGILTLANAADLPVPAANEFFLLTLIGLDANGNEVLWEIVKVTTRAGNTLTVARGQEGTSARAWPDGTVVEMRLTAGGLAGKQDTADNLSALAGLTGAADKLPYFTGAGALSLATLTEAARTLLGATDEAGQRTALGLSDFASGPGSSADNAVARFDGGTGKLLQNSNVTLGDAGELGGISSVNGGALAGSKNKLINADFRIWQRGVSIAAPSGAFTYTADRWLVGANGASLTASQSVISAGNYAIKLSGATGNSYAAVAQRIESNNIEMDVGKPCTFQFQFFSQQARSVYIQLQTATARDNFTGLAQFASVIIPVEANTLQKLTLTAVLPPECVNGVQVIVEPGGIGAGEEVYIWATQLETSNIASIPEFRLQSAEIVNCQRYFQQLFATIRGFTPSAGLNQSATLPFQVCMRAIPTFTITAQAEAFGNVGPGMVVFTNNVFTARYEVQTTGGGEFYALQHLILASAEL